MPSNKLIVRRASSVLVAAGWTLLNHHEADARSVLVSVFSLLSALIAGCAATSVCPISAATPRSAGRPSQFVVYEFAVRTAEAVQNRAITNDAYRSNMSSDDSRLLTTGYEAAEELTDDVARKLTNLEFDTKKLPRGTLPPDGSLVIDGQLLNINEGDLVSRLVIGFGLGASQLDGQVKVYQIADGVPMKLLDFRVHTDSGRMPGDVVTTGLGAVISGGTTLAGAAVSTGLTGLDIHRSTVRSLANSMANRVVGYFSQYAATQGWISQNQADLFYQPQSVQDVARFVNGLR